MQFSVFVILLHLVVNKKFSVHLGEILVLFTLTTLQILLEMKNTIFIQILGMLLEELQFIVYFT